MYSGFYFTLSAAWKSGANSFKWNISFTTELSLALFKSRHTHWWVVLVSVEDTCRLLTGLPSYSPAPLVPHWCMSHCVPVCRGENIHWQKPCEDKSAQYSTTAHMWQYILSSFHMLTLLSACMYSMFYFFVFMNLCFISLQILGFYQWKETSLEDEIWSV